MCNEAVTSNKKKTPAIGVFKKLNRFFTKPSIGIHISKKTYNKINKIG